MLPQLSAVMKIWRLPLEELSLVSSGHAHGGQTREGQVGKLKNRGEMPTEKHTTGIPSKLSDQLPNTQLQLSSNLKY